MNAELLATIIKTLREQGWVVEPPMGQREGDLSLRGDSK
jgi:hypothetical protein